MLEASVFPAPLSPEITQHWQQKSDQCIRNLDGVEINDVSILTSMLT